VIPVKKEKKTEAKTASSAEQIRESGRKENVSPTVSTLTRFKSLISLMSDPTIVLRSLISCLIVPRSLISCLIVPTSFCNVIRIDPWAGEIPAAAAGAGCTSAMAGTEPEGGKRKQTEMTDENQKAPRLLFLRM